MGIKVKKLKNERIDMINNKKKKGKKYLMIFKQKLCTKGI